MEEVFDFVADRRNDPSWCPRVAWCEQREGDGVHAGARYEAFHRPTLQRPHRRAIEVLELERPKRVVTRQMDKIAAVTITYELEPAGADTRMTLRDEIEWRVPSAFVPVGRRIVSRHMGDQLRGLKQLLEARPTS